MSELTKEYLDQKFTKLDQRLEKMDERSKRVDKRLETIIQNMLTEVDVTEIREGLADKNDVDRILTAVDAIAKQMAIYNQELPAITHRLDTITDWIKEASKKIGVEYRP